MSDIACIASIPEREESLKRAVESLVNQVDTIYIVLNGYGPTPDFIKGKKIIGIPRYDNLGDQQKFYLYTGVVEFDYAVKIPILTKDIYMLTIEPNENWFFCDDDLIYPPDYIETSKKHLAKYPDAVLSYHGRRLPKRPIESYYRDRLTGFRCLMEVKSYQDLGVDGALGTGVMFFKSSTVKMKMQDFKHKNMADVWLAKFAVEQGKKMIVCPHERDWIKYQEQPIGTTIFEKHYNDDKKQTEIYNSIHQKAPDFSGA